MQIQILKLTELLLGAQVSVGTSPCPQIGAHNDKHTPITSVTVTQLQANTLKKAQGKDPSAVTGV